MQKRKNILKRRAIGLFFVVALFVSGFAWAQDRGATQGDVAQSLASVMGLSLALGATAQDAIDALLVMGINPTSGWNANAPVDGGFIAALYAAVQSAFDSGTIVPVNGLNTASACVAAACTAVDVPQSDVVVAIVDAGGDNREATDGAIYGGSFNGGTTGTGSFSPEYDSSSPGSGGGGGVNPSPNS
ncbi:MAG: hypothetical protein JW902_13425 [Syntrophaceae bacterium]|nr:hypothetical protein [Syntrophaceae bacterium]